MATIFIYVRVKLHFIESHCLCKQKFLFDIADPSRSLPLSEVLSPERNEGTEGTVQG
jgi:hypothetical protein